MITRDRTARNTEATPDKTRRPDRTRRRKAARLDLTRPDDTRPDAAIEGAVEPRGTRQDTTTQGGLI